MRSYAKYVRDSILNTEAGTLVSVTIACDSIRFTEEAHSPHPAYGATTRANVRSRIIVCSPPALHMVHLLLFPSS
jgi:hypothetical protein